MKLLLQLSKMEELNVLDNRINGYILSVKDLSINYGLYFDIEQMKNTINYLKENKKEVIININKNIHNNDIPLLIDCLKAINELGVDYVIYYDLAVLNIVKEYNMKINLVYGANTYITNYNIINFYKDSVDGFVLSNEITRQDIKQIRGNTKSKLFCNVLGYNMLLVTKRRLITNYLTHINKEKEKDIYYLEEKVNKDKNIIVETGGVSVIYSKNIINVLDDEVVGYIDYGIINLSLTDYNLDDVFNNKIEVNTNFLDKKTVYKVGDIRE